VVQPGGDLDHARGHPVQQRGHRGPRRGPAIGVEPAPARGPAGRVQDCGRAAGHPAVRRGGHQVDDVGIAHLDPGQRQGRHVQRGQLTGHRVAVHGDHGRPGPRQRHRVGAGGAAEVRHRVDAAGQQPARAAVGQHRSTGLLEGVAGEQQPVGVGAERRPGPFPLPRDAPRGPGQLDAHLGAQPGQRGHRVGAVGEQPGGPDQCRGAGRGGQGTQLSDGVGGLLDGPVVPVRCSHRDSLAHPAGTALPDPVEWLALAWVECQTTQAGT
jgi:hypothetical protein